MRRGIKDEDKGRKRKFTFAFEHRIEGIYLHKCEMI
jgi:hypothetical protein